MNVPMRVALLAVPTLAALLCGCGPKYNLGVPKEVVGRLPYESRIDLLEAENALAVAVDKVDESENEVLRTRESLRRARSRLESAKNEQWKARDQISQEVAKLAVEEAEARLEYLRRRQELNVQNREIEELAFRCAYARFEKSRLDVARKAKVEGSEKLKPEEFDQQVKQCDAEVVQRRKETGDNQQRAEKAKGAWEEKRVAFAKKTFDARASPYVE